MKLNNFIENIEKLAENLAKIAGLNNIQGVCRINSYRKIIEEIEKSTDGAKSLSEYLIYKYYDEENSLFFNDDGSIGFIIELAPIVGSDESITKNLEHFFNDEMPSNSWLQFLLVASNDVSSVIERWKSARTSKIPALKQLERKRERFLYNLASDYQNSIGRIARNYRLYAIFTQKQSDTNLGKFKIFMHNFRQKLDSINLAPRICGIDELIVLVKEILDLDLAQNIDHQFKGTRFKRYDNYRLISEQILTPGISHQIFEDKIEHKTRKLASKCYMVSELPLEFSLNEMIGLLGDGLRDNLSIPARFILSYTIANNLSKGTQSGLIHKGERSIDAADQWYSRNNRDIKREAGEWKDINDRAKNGERFLTEYFQVMITAPSEFIGEAEQSLLSLYNILNWRLDINRYFQFPAMLSILPMHSSSIWNYLSEVRLTRYALSSEVIAKLPIHAEWKGVPEPAALLIGRRGQVFNWNPFYRISSGNYNVCVFGPSGSGKSVFLQEIATSMMAQDAKVFILDIGQSFKNICELLSGETIQFGKNSNIILNPFNGFKNSMLEEDRIIAKGYAKAIICTMCGAKGDSLKESIIEKAISRGLEQYGSDLNISKLADVLINLGTDSNNSEVATNLSLSLFSYTKAGLHGKFFNSEDSNYENISKMREVKFDKQITVFEFEEIKNDPLLLSVVLQIISMQIFMQVLTGDRSKRFMLIVDEAWMILDYAAKFLAELARTIRKYGGSLVVCVQNFNDLASGEQQKAILENSTWTVLLKQDEKGINSFKSSEAFKDKIPLIKSISISPGKYAEALFCTTGISVVGRLVLDSYSNILYSTDSDIFRTINELKSSGISLDEAINIISERRMQNA